eukprot:9979103-Alexandrium_andersonii.AAC.1
MLVGEGSRPPSASAFRSPQTRTSLSARGRALVPSASGARQLPRPGPPHASVLQPRSAAGARRIPRSR